MNRILILLSAGLLTAGLASCNRERQLELSPATPPPIDAVVQAMQAVNPREHLIVLSVGKAQGVQVGFEFTVHRGNKFIGKAKVIKVYPDVSGAQVLWTVDGEEIKIGDQATTSL